MEKTDFGKNSFDILRLYGVIYIITTYILSRVLPVEMPSVVTWWNGVTVMFCMSGFLVGASVERSESIREFLKKRALRVLPLMWVCIIITTLTAGLLCGFTADKTFWIWLTGQLCFIRDLPQPDFIANFASGVFMEGLWTMVHIAQFYIITALIYKLLKNRGIKVWTIVLAVSMVFNLLAPYLEQILPETGGLIVRNSFLKLFYVYFAGWFMYRWRDIILPVLTRTKILCVLLLIARGIYCAKTGACVGAYQDMIIVLLLCMLTVGAGYSFGRIKVKIDLSYGLFLYSVVAVDIFVQLGLTGNIAYVILVYAVSALCAAASYFLVDGTVKRIFKSTADMKYSDVEIQEAEAEEAVVVHGAEESDF